MSQTTRSRQPVSGREGQGDFEVDHVAGSTILTLSAVQLADPESVRAIRLKVVELAEETAPSDLLLNLDRVPFVCSEGLGLLSLVASRLRAGGGRLIVCRAAPVVEDALRCTSLDWLMVMQSTLPAPSAALRELSTRPDDERTRQVHDERGELDQLRAQFKSFGLVGTSAASLDVFRRARQFAETFDTSILISGETGTGKQLMARSIHELDPVRRSGPFHVLDCTAITESLAESQLFGHVAGAFTGADRERPGAFRAAQGGTLFLDEIGELKPDLQPRLLVALEDRCFQPVGTDQTCQVDVRVIAATNRPLRDMVEQGTFRRDLYHRLARLQIEIPPLRDRPDDIEALALHFLQGDRGSDHAIGGLTHDACASLRSYAWPGNVRELENVIGQALATGHVGSTFQYSDLPMEFHRDLAAAGTVAAIGPGTLETDALIQRVLHTDAGLAQVRNEFEKQCICGALREAQGNQLRAAEILRISRTWLRNRLKHFGVRAW